MLQKKSDQPPKKSNFSLKVSVKSGKPQIRNKGSRPLKKVGFYEKLGNPSLPRIVFVKSLFRFFSVNFGTKSK